MEPRVLPFPFSRKDDGADIVETSYLFEGLLCARQYFNQQTPLENELRNRINWLWNGAEWNWHQRDHGKFSLLALESQQRLGHEFRNPRME